MSKAKFSQPGTLFRRNKAILPEAQGFRTEITEVPGLAKATPAFSSRATQLPAAVVHPAVQKKETSIKLPKF